MKTLSIKWRVWIKRFGLSVIDALICAISGIISGIAVFNGYDVFSKLSNEVYAVVIGTFMQIASMALFGGYRYVVKYSDIHYNVRLVCIALVNFMLEMLTIGGLYGFAPGALFSIIQTSLSFSAIIVTRFFYQFYVDFKDKKDRINKGKRIMIIGAGWTGKRVLQDLSRSHEKYYPVCFIDDDPEKKNMIMDNVPIVGSCSSIEENVVKYSVDKIIFAIPSAKLEVRNEIISQCLSTGREVNILPNMEDLVAKADIMSFVRKVQIDDLLQRDEIKFETKDIENFIFDKVCLVTGGGGSIGSELCRQISSYSPKKLIILDIYENGAFDIVSELKEKYGDKLKVQVEIMSVTDEAVMDKLFAREKIDVIFHAAAHKHVPLMEHNPEESIKNNVVGTNIVAKLATKHKVKKVIMVSTDKAVNPTNVMGATKRFCEKIVGYYGAHTKDTVYAVVRFGNVLGSNGSVVHIFNRQIAAGGPVKVTDPEMIRYFMTIPEAVSLILQAGVFAGGGEVFVLDMGKPVKIQSLAENMIRLAGFVPNEEIKIEYTGLRPGEKLYEELLMSEEGMQKTPNNKIFIGNQSYISEEDVPAKYQQLVSAANTNDDSVVISALQSAVETYTPDKRFH
ncbi:MAG: nucleoside-diphosphate sugar epimerase/dehydratase [Clostridia bacterium]